MIESVMELILNAVLVVYLFVGQSEKDSEQLESIPTNQTVISENTAERKMSNGTSTLTGNSSRAQNKKSTKQQKIKNKKSKLLQ